MLDDESRRELRSLSKETSDLVARHLVMTGRLMDTDPEQGLAHARAARALAGRIGVVREAAGLAAYTAGEWNEALSELRAARRITGRPEHLAVLADCERALGRPERALAYGDDAAVPTLSQDERVELVIVLAGARRDLGQADAAVLMLQEPAKRTSAQRPWAARLWYAYADALLVAGRDEQAREWFEKTAGVDAAGATDAVDRLLELDGVALDLLDGEDDDEDDFGGGPLDDSELLALVVEGFGTAGAPGPILLTHPQPEVEVTPEDESAPAPADRDELDEVAQVDQSADRPGDVTAAADHLLNPHSEGIAPAGAGRPDADGARPVDAQQPFSDREAVVVVSTKRPPAALVPTFAAPSVSDGAVAEQTDPGTDDDGQLDSSTDSPDEDDLTLFS